MLHEQAHVQLILAVIRSDCILYISERAGVPGSTPLDMQRPDGEWVKVWPILGQVEGDIPFLVKLTNSIGHTGKHACFHCALEGTWVPSANTHRFAAVE